MTIKKIILRLAKLKAGMEVLNKKASKQEFDRAYKVAAAIESAETEDEKEAAAIFAAEAAAAEVPDDEAVDAYLKVYRDVEEEVRNNAT